MSLSHKLPKSSETSNWEDPYKAGWLTTADVARMLERSPRGVRWLADQEHLSCERTLSQQRLFRSSDVLRLVEKRAKARLRGVRVLRPKRIGLRDGPQQLSLFARHLQLVPRPRPLDDFATGGGSTARAIAQGKTCV